jgi:AI-2 transport protein TqsA
MTPVTFALFIIALVWPLQRRLQTILPQVIAVLVTAAVVVLAIGGGGWLVVWGFGGIAQWVIANAARLQGLYMHAAELLEQRGLYAAELFAEQVNVLWLARVLRAIGGSLQDVLSFAIVTFVFVILGLIEVEPLERRLRDGPFGTGAIDAAAEIAARLQTYMLVRFGMSVLTGLGFWVFTAVDGLELQREWGVMPSSSTSYPLSDRSLPPCCPLYSRPPNSNRSTLLS